MVFDYMVVLTSARNQYLYHILSVSTSMLVVRNLDDGLPALLNRHTDPLYRGRAYVPLRLILVSCVDWLRIPSKLLSTASQ